MDAVFSTNLTALRVVADTAVTVPAGYAVLPKTIPAAIGDPTVVVLCPADTWPWAVAWHKNAADVTSSQDGHAVPFAEPNVRVYVDAALAVDTFLKVKSGGTFGDAAGAVPCARLLEASAGAGLYWATTVIGRLRNTANAAITTSGPTYSGSAYAVIAEMTATVDIRTGAAFVVGFCTFDVQHEDSFDFALFIDGAQASIARPVQFFGGSLLGLTPARIEAVPLQFAFPVSGLVTGSHVFDIRASVSAGSMRAVGTARSLQVVEI